MHWHPGIIGTMTALLLGLVTALQAGSELSTARTPPMRASAANILTLNRVLCALQSRNRCRWPGPHQRRVSR